MKHIPFVVLAIIIIYARKAQCVGSSEKGKSVVQATIVDTLAHADHDGQNMLHAQSSSSMVGASVAQGHGKQGNYAWSKERRAKFKQTIAERRQAVKMGLAQKVQRDTWTQAQREKYRETIATRTVTDEMKTNWSNARRKVNETLRARQAMASDDSTTTTKEAKPRASWTAARHENFRQSIATRTVTEEMRENWSKAHRGVHHTDETKFFMSMRKLGTGQLRDSEKKATKRKELCEQADNEQGRRHSDETRKRMSIAAKARWAKERVKEHNRQSTGDSATRRSHQTRVAMSIAQKERWVKVRAYKQQATGQASTNE